MRRFDDPDCDVLVERLAKRNRLSLFATCSVSAADDTGLNT